jgi:hypothetical protein
MRRCGGWICPPHASGGIYGRLALRATAAAIAADFTLLPYHITIPTFVDSDHPGRGAVNVREARPQTGFSGWCLAAQPPSPTASKGRLPRDPGEPDWLRCGAPTGRPWDHPAPARWWPAFRAPAWGARTGHPQGVPLRDRPHGGGPTGSPARGARTGHPQGVPLRDRWAPARRRPDGIARTVAARIPGTRTGVPRRDRPHGGGSHPGHPHGGGPHGGAPTGSPARWRPASRAPARGCPYGIAGHPHGGGPGVGALGHHGEPDQLWRGASGPWPDMPHSPTRSCRTRMRYPMALRSSLPPPSPRRR